MDECTFKPKIVTSSKEIIKKVPIKSEDSKIVKGYEKVVERYRAAADEKKKIQDKIDKYF